MASYNEFDSIWAPPNKAVDDRGATHDRVQDAVDNAQEFVMIGPGTFTESVTVTDPEMGIRGAGPGTLIDGGDETAVIVDAEEVNVDRLSVRSERQAQTGASGIEVTANGAASVVNLVRVSNSDSQGILIDAPDATAFGCVVDTTESAGILIGGPRSTALGCRVKERVGGDGVQLSAEQAAAVGCNIDNPGFYGVDVSDSANHATIGLNTISDPGEAGVRIAAAESVSLGLNSVMRPAGVYYDVADALNLQTAANSPTVGSAGGNESTSIPFSEIPDGDYVAIPVHIPDDETLDVWAWGCQTGTQTQPDGLTVQLYDETNDTLVAEESTPRTEGTPTASLEAANGALDATLRLNNATGASVDAGANFDYTVR